ncbi:MAG: J domain-containing protein [Calditrichaeota bacterium]|nr:MAG: J domain-containing protein [Calditrichota bacterium]
MDPRKDYCKILGVSETASQDEIKRAYRELAKKYHPDAVGGDKAKEERFKEISEAYSVLSDPAKRKEYDTMRRNPFAGQQGGYDFQGAPGGFRVHFESADLGDLSDLFGDFVGRGSRTGESFSRFFDLGDLFGNARQKTRTRRATTGADVEAQITIPFELAVNGGETVISTGTGKRIKIKIPPGTEDGKRIRIRGQGQPSPNGGPAGDLFVVIRVAPHPEFERKGKDIYSTLHINLAEAVLGTEKTVQTVGGKRVKLKIPPGTSSGKLFRLPGLGVPAENGAGDHYVRVLVDVPEHLTPGQRKEFKEWAKKVGLIN